MEIDKRMSKRKIELINIVERIICRQRGLPKLPKGRYTFGTKHIVDRIFAWEKRERKNKWEKRKWWRLSKYRLIRIIEMYLLHTHAITGRIGEEYQGQWWDDAYIIATTVYQWLKQRGEMLPNSFNGDKLGDISGPKV